MNRLMGVLIRQIISDINTFSIEPHKLIYVKHINNVAHCVYNYFTQQANLVNIGQLNLDRYCGLLKQHSQPTTLC